MYLDVEEWDPDEDRFELTPLTSEALAWERELTAIFERWDAARRAGTITWNEDEDTFGALPNKMERRHYLNWRLEGYLAQRCPVMLARGAFDLGARLVRWEPVQELGTA